MVFQNRQEAGLRLADEIAKLELKDPIVLALPRGGVLVGSEVGNKLRCPLNVIVSRKVGSPSNPEFGIGAVSEKNVVVLSGLKEASLQKIIRGKKQEVKKMVEIFRRNKKLPNLEGRDVVLVDDGLATGVTAKAAILAVKKLRPRKIIFASPICAQDSSSELSREVDTIICLQNESEVGSIGFWYQDFHQVTDSEVMEYLAY